MLETQWSQQCPLILADVFPLQFQMTWQESRRAFLEHPEDFRMATNKLINRFKHLGYHQVESHSSYVWMDLSRYRYDRDQE